MEQDDNSKKNNQSLADIDSLDNSDVLDNVGISTEPIDVIDTTNKKASVDSNPLVNCDIKDNGELLTEPDGIDNNTNEKLLGDSDETEKSNGQQKTKTVTTKRILRSKKKKTEDLKSDSKGNKPKKLKRDDAKIDNKNSSETRSNKEPKDFYYTVGKIDIDSNKVTLNDIFDSKLFKGEIRNRRYDLNIHCPVIFNGGVRENLGNRVAYLVCKNKKHLTDFKLDIIEYITAHGKKLQVTCNSTVKEPLCCCTGSDRKKTASQLRYQERKDKAIELRDRSTRQVHMEAVNKCDEEKYREGDSQQVRSVNTLYRVHSDDINSSILSKKSIDVADLVDMYIEKSVEEADNPLQFVAMPLQVSIYTERQLKIIDLSRESTIFYICAVQAYCAKPQFLKTEDIFYFPILYEAKMTTIPLSEFITIKIDYTTLCIHLMQYRKFTRDRHCNWPICNVIITDFNWIFIKAVLYE